MRLTTDPLHESVGVLVDGSPVDGQVQFAIETTDAEVAIESLLGIVNVLRKLGGKEAVTVKGAGQVRRRGPKQPKPEVIEVPAEPAFVGSNPPPRVPDGVTVNPGTV